MVIPAAQNNKNFIIITVDNARHCITYTCKILCLICCLVCVLCCDKPALKAYLGLGQKKGNSGFKYLLTQLKNVPLSCYQHLVLSRKQS